MMMYLGYTVWQADLRIAKIESWCTAYKQGARSGCKITHINGTAISTRTATPPAPTTTDTTPYSPTHEQQQLMLRAALAFYIQTHRNSKILLFRRHITEFMREMKMWLKTAPVTSDANDVDNDDHDSWNDYLRLAKGRQAFSMKLLYKSREQYDRAVVRRKWSFGARSVWKLRDAFWRKL